MNLKEREQLACNAIDNHAVELKELAIYIHNNPELSEEEFESSRYTAEFLKKHGFNVTYPLPEVPMLPTSLKGIIGDGKYKIAFLSEYDALPGLGHACGHNLINMMSVGAAIGCNAAAHDIVETTLFGCPAEETIGGKVFMSKAGLFKGHDAALIIHPGHVSEVGGSALATHPLQVRFIGREAHVASLTDKGINALDALVTYYQRVKDAKANFEEFALIGTNITEGGLAPNIIPAKATLRMTVRAKTVDYLENVVLPTIMNIAEEVASETGTKVEMEFYEPLFKDLRQDKILNKLFYDAMLEYGERPEVLADDVADGSTDVGNVSYDLPTSHPTLAIGTDFEAHTPGFELAAGSEYALEQGIKGAKIMAITALRYIDYLENKKM